MSSKLLIGFGRRDITPEESIPLAGIGNTSQRMSTNVRDNLYTTCVAFTDADGETALMFNSDLISAKPAETDALREMVEKELGVPGNRVMLSCTHSHSVPDTGNTEKDCIPRYRALMLNAQLEAAKEALADRKPAQMFIGRTTAERLNFIRHYVLDENGKPCAHTAEADPQLQMVKIVREGGEDILMMNWQAHPCLSSTLDRYCVSADYIGEVRSFLEDKFGCKFIFFQGAAGNHNVRSKIKGECPTMDPKLYGALLGYRAMVALTELKPISPGKVRSTETVLTLDIDHTEDHMVPKAETVRDYWVKTNDRKATDAMAKPLGMNSPYHAGAILRRAKMPASREMTICSVAVGELAFTCAPYEMFCDNGQFIKGNSPFEATFVVSCCNQVNAYLASKLAFDYGCYEKDNRNFVRGTAEKVADAFVEQLRALK